MSVLIFSLTSCEQLESVLEHEAYVSTHEAASSGWVSVAFLFVVGVFAALFVSDMKENKSKARCSVTCVWTVAQPPVLIVLAGAYSHALVTKNHHSQLLERAKLPGTSYSTACTRHALCRPEENSFFRVRPKKSLRKGWSFGSFCPGISGTSILPIKKNSNW